MLEYIVYSQKYSFFLCAKTMYFSLTRTWPKVSEKHILNSRKAMEQANSNDIRNDALDNNEGIDDNYLASQPIVVGGRCRSDGEISEQVKLMMISVVNRFLGSNPIGFEYGGTWEQIPCGEVLSKMVKREFFEAFALDCLDGKRLKLCTVLYYMQGEGKCI